MNWKERASPSKPVATSTQKTGSWRDRATPVDYEAEATLAAEKKYEETKPSAMESAATGFLQGATRDWGDEAVAGLRSLAPGGGPYAEEKLRTQDQFQRAQLENPKTYGGSEIGGAMASTPMASTPFGMAAMGAVDAGARSFGKSKELNTDAAIEAANEAATGGIVGGTLGVLAPAVTPQMGKIKDYLKNKSAERAVQALRPTQGQMRKLQESGKITDVGKMMLDEGVVTPFASNAKMAERVGDLTENLNAQTKPIYQASKQSNMSTEDLLNTIDDRISQLRPNPGNKPIIEKLQAQKAAIEESGATTFNPQELRSYRGRVDDTINWQSDKPTQLGGKEMRGILREAEMGQIEKVDPALRAQNEDLFRKLHLGYLAEDIAPRGEARNSVNNILGLNTYATGGAIAPTMAALGMGGGTTAAVTAAAMAAREIARRYGPQMSAVAMDRLEKGIANNPRFSQIFENAAQKGPQAVLIVHNMLMQKDPEYKKLMQEGGQQ